MNLNMNKKKVTQFSATGIIGLLLLANMTYIVGANIIPLISYFTPNKSQADINEPITFEFEPENVDFTAISYYIIDFHDGTKYSRISASKTMISHSFENEGKFLVTLIAVSYAGLTDQMTCEVEIVNLPPEIINLNVPQYIYEDHAVNISVGDVIDSVVDENELKYNWDFGDGNYKSGDPISYVWSEAGIYPITLTVIDNQGAFAMKTEYIEVINMAPVVDFIIEPVICDCPYVININETEAIILEACPLYFNASLSYDTISDINSTQYYWDFGDGQVDWGIFTEHQFIQSGNYIVTLKAKDDNGDIGICQKTVQVVNEAPTVNVLTEDLYLKEGTTFTFNTNSTDSLPDYPLLNYTWNFGESGWRPSNTWMDDYNGSASVIVKDPEGLYDTDFTNVVVENVPPHINLNWAYVDMNITMEISAPTSKTCNFSMEFLENNETIGVYVVTKPAGNHSFTTPLLPFFMDLSQDYTIIVNRTHELEPGTYYIDLTFSYLDGNDFSIGTSFNEHWPGWKVDPNEWVVNPDNYLFDVPITFGGSIFDPSIDDIHLDVNFKIHLLFEIDFPDSHNFTYPYRTKITLPHDFNHIVYDAYIYKENGKIYSDLTFTQDLITTDYLNNEFPADIFFNPTFYPIDLSFLELHDKISIGGAFIINVIEAVNIIEVNVTDDDGGEDYNSVKIDTTKCMAEVDNLGPDVYIYTYHNASEDSTVPMLVDVMDFENDTVSVVWDFGDGSPKVIDPQNGSDIYHTYENEGLYLITVTASDGKMISKTGRLIQILNRIPEVELLNINPIKYEDAFIELSGATYIYDDSDSDMDSLRFYWDYGDGSTYYQLEKDRFWCDSCSEIKSGHRYRESGLYNLTLKVIDDNGGIGYFIVLMNISNFAPIIVGSFGFEEVEGNVIILDVDVFDSIKDECSLDYKWDIQGQILNGTRPSVYLNGGYYTLNLTVSDEDGARSSANITIIVEDIAPMVFVSSKSIYGAPGEIEITAYTKDIFLDSDNIQYNWNINNETYIQTYEGASSTITYNYEESSILTGIVEVFDDAGKRGFEKFQLLIIMDSDGDGLTDEFEAEIDSSPDSSDSDGDYITDWYELNIYGTDPLNPDTDGDGLPDGFGMTPYGLAGELWLGTDPLLDDTDADNLTDGFEFFGWTLLTEYYNETIEEKTNITYWVNSDPLKLDTDGDKLSDWEEYIHGTDPRNKDTDNDGRCDLLDIFPGRKDSDEDGLSDLKEFEIGSDPGKVDSDDDGLSDGEEYYPGEDGYITNATNPDTDDDLLLDGEEIFTEVKEISNRKKIEVGSQTYSLNFENGKRVANASVIISISVGEGGQTTNLTLILSLRGSELFKNYYENERYFTKPINVKDLVENIGGNYGGEWMLEVFSTTDCLLEEYSLKITKYLNPLNNDTDGDGILDGVEVDPKLNNGWITNPNKWDTDGDTINDKYEIERGWNPLSKDTDGDGVEDWRDADPLYNLIVMVNVKEGHYDSWEQLFTPLLQVTLEVEADPEHKWEVATPSKYANTGPKDIKVWIPWLCESCWDISWTLYWLECQWRKKCKKTWLGKICWYELRCRWRSRVITTQFCIWLPCLIEETLWTIQTTATFNSEYYFDVDDGDTNLKVKGELWKNYIVGWLPHVSGEINYNFMKPDYQMNAQYDKKIYSGSNYISLDIVTKGVPRVNTIAVFEEDQFENGHYSSTERMNIVMLNVISDTIPEGFPFKSGLNTILIPTSVFTNTKLHAIIETSVDENGQVSNSSWNNVPSSIKGAKISGIDRDNYKNTISPNVECVISKNVTAAEAYDILLLAVTSANESEGVIYGFTREYRAEELGIAADVLELIPLDMSEFENDRTGVWPRTPWENFIQLLQDVINFIIDVLIAIGDFFIALFEWIAEVGMNLIEAIAKAVLYIVEALLKAIILVFLYLMFAFTLIMALAMYVSITVLALIVGPFLGAGVTITINSVTIQKDELYLTYEYNIGLKYWEFLDLYIPTVFITFETTYMSYESPFNFFELFTIPSLESLIPSDLSSDSETTNDNQLETSNHLSSDFQTTNDNQPETSVDLSNNFQTTNNNQPLESSLKTSNTNSTEWFNETDFWEGMFLAFDVSAIFFLALGVSSTVTGSNKIAKLANYAVIIAFALTLTALVLGFVGNPEISLSFMLGFILGPWISLLVTSVVATVVGALFKPSDTAGDIFEVIGLVLTVIGVITTIFTILNSLFNTDYGISDDIIEEQMLGHILAFGGLILGGIGIGLQDDSDKDNAIIALQLATCYTALINLVFLFPLFVELYT